MVYLCKGRKKYHRRGGDDRMTRNEFLSILESSLGNINQSDRIDILYDYKEHFNAGMSEGKSEGDICMALGDPKVIAKQYRVDCIVKQADENRTAGNILRAIFAALSLGFFNLIITLPVFASLIAVMISLYAAAVSITVAGVGAFLAIFLQPVLPEYIMIPDINMGVVIFGSIGLTALGLLFCIGCVYVSKFFYQITIKYIKANIKIISR